MYKAFRKYGIENFKFIELYSNLSEKEAKNKEQELIAKFKTLTHENGYNITKGGDLRAIYGEMVNTNILAETEVIKIYERIENGERIATIYEDYKERIKYSSFQSLYTKNWKHLKQPKKVLPCGAKHSKQDVDAIRELYAEGMNPKQISRTLNLSYKTCWMVCTGRAYVHV